MNTEPTWLQEYTLGTTYELYGCQLAERFVGLPFAQVFAKVFEEIGVRLPRPHDGDIRRRTDSNMPGVRIGSVRVRTQLRKKGVARACLFGGEKRCVFQWWRGLHRGLTSVWSPSAGVGVRTGPLRGSSE